jgi:hypothetical protein
MFRLGRESKKEINHKVHKEHKENLCEEKKRFLIFIKNNPLCVLCVLRGLIFSRYS